MKRSPAFGPGVKRVISPAAQGLPVPSAENR
jgi:hypothetical protein